MDIAEILSNELIDKAAPILAETVLREVAARIKTDLVFRYSEEEAAAKLGIEKHALAKIRKDGLIEYSYSILPTMDGAGKMRGGRISYLPQHLEEYLARNEQKRLFGKLKAA